MSANKSDQDEGQPRPKGGGGRIMSEVVDQFRETTAGMKEAFNRGKGKLYHVVTANNRIVQFRIGVDGTLKLGDSVKTINLNEARKRLLEAGLQVPITAQKQMRQAITGDPNKRIRDHMKETPQVKMIDKMSFTMGVGVITLSEFIILRFPLWFVSFFTWFMLFLFLLRFFMYKRQKYHFFMLDFCYLVNASCMLHSYIDPNNLTWFHINFAVTMGPLCSAIIVWHNSLVFHSLDKLTSFFLHAFPPMLYHLYRWRLIPTDTIRLDQTVTAKELYLPALGFYLSWQILYLFCTEVVYRDTLSEDPSLVTSMRYMTKDTKNPLTKIVINICRKIRLIGKDELLDPSQFKTVVVYTIVQLIYTMITMIPSYFVYQSYYGCCVYLVSVFLAATWNGASYYIEVFSKRYNMKFAPKSPPPEESKTESASSKDSSPVDDTEDDENEVYSEAMEELSLNESQAKELFQILNQLDNERATINASESGESLSDIPESSQDNKTEEGQAN